MSDKRKSRRDESWREKIQAGVIMDRMLKCYFGEIELTPAQLQAGKIILAKIIPDLKTVETKGEITHNYVLRAPEVSRTAEEWQQANPQVSIQ